VPSSIKKTDVVGPIPMTNTQTQSIFNGQTTFDIILSAPAPSGVTPACPGGQTLQLMRSSYTNVVISDSFGIVTAVPGTFTSACLLPGGC